MSGYVSDYALLRNFVRAVAESPDENLNEVNWRALRADARDHLFLTQATAEQSLPSFWFLGEPVWGPFVADDLPGGEK